jgi:AraC family transcriptional regulator of arabinose operon
MMGLIGNQKPFLPCNFTLDIENSRDFMHNSLMAFLGEVAQDLQVLSVGAYQVHPEEFLIDRPQGSGDYLLLRFESPTLIRMNQSYREVPTGSCLLYAPDQPQWYRGSGGGLHNSWMHFHATNIGFAVGETFMPSNSDFFAPLLVKIEREIARREVGFEAMASLLAQRLLIMLTRVHPATEKLSPQSGGISEALADIRAEIRARPQAKWTVEKMARRVHLSESRFSVLYRAQFGASPGDDVIEARLTKARYLLLGRGVSVEFVARECGFASPFYFSRLFKSKTGVAPRDYYREKMAGVLGGALLDG